MDTPLAGHWPVLVPLGIAVVLPLLAWLRNVYIGWRFRQETGREIGTLPGDRAAVGLDEELPSIDWRKVLGEISVPLSLVALPAIAVSLGLSGWSKFAALGGLIVVALAYDWWRRLNAPTPDPYADDYSGPPEMEVPWDAKAGFATALALVAFILLIAFALN